jgi:hypothetical protein
MRLGGGSASGATAGTVLVDGSGGVGRSGTEATIEEVSRSMGSRDTSGLAETEKRQRQCGAAAMPCPEHEPASRVSSEMVLGTRCATRCGPGLCDRQHDEPWSLRRPAFSQQAAGAVLSQAAGWRSGGQQQWPVAWPRQSWPVSQRHAPPCARAAFASARSSRTICAIRICRRRIGMGFVGAGPGACPARSAVSD